MTKVDSLSLFVKFTGISPTTPQFHKFQKSSLDFRRFLLELKKKSKQLMCIARHPCPRSHSCLPHCHYQWLWWVPSGMAKRCHRLPPNWTATKTSFPQRGRVGFCKASLPNWIITQRKIKMEPPNNGTLEDDLPFELGRLLRWTSRSLLGIFRECSLDFCITCHGFVWKPKPNIKKFRISSGLIIDAKLR